MNYNRMSSFLAKELCSLATESLEYWDQSDITKDRFVVNYNHLKKCLGEYDAPIYGEMSVLNYNKTLTRVKRMGEIIKSWDAPIPANQLGEDIAQATQGGNQ